MKRPRSLPCRSTEARSIFVVLACSLLPSCTYSRAVDAGQAQLRGSQKALFDMLFAEMKEVSKLDQQHDQRNNEMNEQLQQQSEAAEQRQQDMLDEQNERHRFQEELNEKRRQENENQQKLDEEARENQLAEETEKAAAEERQYQENVKHMETNIRKQMTSDLEYAHHQIEDSPGGWKGHDSSWRDLYKKSDISHLWKLLTAEAIGESLRAAGLSAQSRVLIVEPSALGLKQQFAKSIADRSSGASVQTATFGSEPAGPFDLLIELGVLDDMAMGANHVNGSRPASLRDAVSRFTHLLQPNGAWVEVSSVPPVLRLPLLEKLNEQNFNPIVPARDVQTVVVNRSKAENDRLLFEDEQAFTADMLLYGDTSLHVFSYVQSLHKRMEPVPTTTLAPSLLHQFLAAIDKLVQLQRPFGAHGEL